MEDRGRPISGPSFAPHPCESVSSGEQKFKAWPAPIETLGPGRRCLEGDSSGAKEPRAWLRLRCDGYEIDPEDPVNQTATAILPAVALALAGACGWMDARPSKA